jgi:hypothetical protein
MALRSFTDAAGDAWQVWDVVPQRVAAASEERQAPEPAGEPGGVRQRPGVLTPGLEEGWLCFESRREKRRLTPIPEGWHDAPPERLEALCRTARAVKRRDASAAV